MRVSFRIAIACILVSLAAGAQPKPLNDSTWQLAFHDEFNGSSVDGATWWWTWGNCPIRSYNVFYDWLNFNAVDTLSNKNILAYPTPNFANCDESSGTLKIRSKKERRDSCKVWDRWVTSSFCYGAPQSPPIPCPIDSFVTFKYTTGLLISKERFRYGYYEIRMKLPDPATTYANKGLGPNFWLYYSNDTTIWSEIDIYEFAGYDNLTHNTNYHTSNIHHQKYAPGSFGTLTTNPADTIHVFDGSGQLGSIHFGGGYHTFGIDWRPERVDYYYDGIVYRTSSVSGAFPDKLTEMHMLIDINHPSANFATLVDTNQTVFPFTYEIDYVRCWQYKQHCDSVLSICNFNYAGFDQAIYKRITAGGSGCNATIAPAKGVSFHANDFVLLNEGFEAGNNVTFLADVTPCVTYVNPNRTVAPIQSTQGSPFLNPERKKWHR